MGDLAGEQDLALEPPERLRRRPPLRPDGLQRHRLAQRQILGLVHLAHAALGDEASSTR